MSQKSLPKSRIKSEIQKSPLRAAQDVSKLLN